MVPPTVQGLQKDGPIRVSEVGYMNLPFQIGECVAYLHAPVGVFNGLLQRAFEGWEEVECPGCDGYGDVQVPPPGMGSLDKSTWEWVTCGLCFGRKNLLRFKSDSNLESQGAVREEDR